MGHHHEIGPTRVFCEEAGSGDPVVLLHGGLGHGTSWGAQVPALAACHHVFVPDRRGHGRTADTDAPFSYDDMAAETIGFLETVVGGPAHLVGWSDGGIVALLVGRTRPDLVRRLVAMGANFHHDGLDQPPELDGGPDGEFLDLIRTDHDAVCPDGPEHWPVFYEKTATMWRTQPTRSVDDLRAITPPTLVLVGDDEPIRLDHTVALYEALPDAQLAVVPGASHALALEKPELVNQLILGFLAETAPPVTLLPVRRGRPGSTPPASGSS